MEMKSNDPGHDDLDRSMTGWFIFFWGLGLGGLALIASLIKTWMT